jgi:hypothetical protein
MTAFIAILWIMSLALPAASTSYTYLMQHGGRLNQHPGMFNCTHSTCAAGNGSQLSSC